MSKTWEQIRMYELSVENRDKTLGRSTKSFLCVCFAEGLPPFGEKALSFQVLVALLRRQREVLEKRKRKRLARKSATKQSDIHIYMQT